MYGMAGGDVPRRHWLSLPLWCPAGGARGRSPANPAFSFPSCPLSPSPLPRRGRGSPKVYFAGGFAPGTPALDRSRHLQPLPSGHPGGRTRAALAIPAAVVPGGGLALFAVRLPCLYLLFCPLSPRPRSQSALPQRGRGSPKVYFAGGFAPGTPALDRSRHLQPLPSGHPGGRTRAALAIPAAVAPCGVAQGAVTC